VVKKTNRRKFIFGSLAGLGLGLLGAWIFRRPILKSLIFRGDFDAGLLNAAPSGANDYCVLTSRQVEGPFFFPSPERRDIREDRKGLALELQFRIVRYPDCTPIEGAVVDIWHCDAEGAYSGYPEEITHDVWKSAVFLIRNSTERNGEMHVDPVNDNRFLRGRQTTDNDGWVTFDTIFPGWYEGRAPHIHAKIITSENEQLTTQFYFDTNLCDEIYTTHAPYDKYGKCPVKIENDMVLASFDKADGLLLKITAGANMNATAKIGVKTA
jgi:protocatechuate 3,4-dioxygenase beta subunit